jgi:hypothetical protein
MINGRKSLDTQRKIRCFWAFKIKSLLQTLKNLPCEGRLLK